MTAPGLVFVWYLVIEDVVAVDTGTTFSFDRMIFRNPQITQIFADSPSNNLCESA